MASTTSYRFDVEALRQAHPIADVIAGYGIELRPTGGALVGRCPFHNDGGRPNLHVYPATQSWYCFRCNVGGDAIEFVKRREQVGFVEACQRLAVGQGEPMSRPPSPQRMPRERRWDRLTLEEQVVMNAACALYQHSLWHEREALAYLRERGLPDWVIRQSALGFADGHSLEAYLRRRSGLRVGQDLGLLSKLERGDSTGPVRETLAGRIVVPELRGGHCLWFIGRRLEVEGNFPKYMALPGERPVLGLQRVVGRREAYLCEGVFDYLTAISWKLPAFSPCGTHLPAERLGFLARTEVVYGVLDGDEAGRAAAERFGKLLGARWRPIRLPEGCDLNDLGRRPGGRAEFFGMLAAVRRAAGEEACHGR